MSVSTYHPTSLVETAPLLLPPLAEALTEEQHKQQLDEQQRQVSSVGAVRGMESGVQRSPFISVSAAPSH